MMNKRKRELTARLEDLFSTPAEAADGEEQPLAPVSGLSQLINALASNNDPSFLAKFFDHLPLPIYVKDREHKWVAANPAFCQILRRQASQLIGRADKDQSDDEWQHDDHVLETGQPEEAEISFTDDSGLIQRRSISRLPVLDQDGRPQFVIGIMPPAQEAKPVDLANVEEEILKRNRELAAINQISQALAARADLRTAIQKVGDIIRRLFNVSEAYIALYDQTTNMLELPFFIEGNQPATIPPIPLGQGISSIVVQSRKPLLINRDTARRMQELGAIITGKQAQSYLGVPILAGDEAIGVISIQSVDTPGLFNDDDVQLLATVAANIGTTIRNAQLFEEAQHSEQRFHLIADTTPIPILISRAADGMVLYANKHLGPMFGISKDELIGQTAPNFYYNPADREKLLEQVHREGRLTHHEVHVKKIDGTPFWTLISIEPLVFNGEPAILSSFYDITERKLAEGQVLQRNMQLAVLNRISQRLSHLAEPAQICELVYEEMGQILNNENLYIALYDKTTNLISFPVYTIGGNRQSNPSRLFGNALTEHIILTKEPLLLERDAAAEIAKLGLASSGQPAQSWMGAPLMVGKEAIGVIAVQDYKKPGAFRPDQLEVLITVASQTAIALENSRLFTQAQQELAERKLAEKELLKLKLGFEQSNDAIFITDINGQITYVNPGFTKLYGYTSNEAIGQTPRLIKSGLLTGDVYKNFWGALLSKNTVAGEIVNKTKDGRLVTIEGNNNPIVDESGTIIGFLGVHRDATERKQAEQAIQKRAEQLAALNRIGRQLVQLAPADEIFETVYQSVGELIDNRNFFIALHDEGNPQIRYPIYTFDNVRSEPFSRNYGRALTEHVLETKQSVLIPQDVDGYVAKIGIESVGRTAHCWMGVPLLVGEKAIGVIALQDYEKAKVYSQSDVELMTIIASQAAIALENARLFGQTTARVQELAALNEVGRAASGLLESHELLDIAYQQISKVMRTDSFRVGLYDPDRQMMTYPLCYEGGVIHEQPDSALDPSTHIYTVITQGEPLFIEYSEEERKTIIGTTEMKNGETEYLPGSVILVPLKIGDRVIGVISVQSDEPGQHSRDNLNLLTNIANQIAISIENIRLFEQTRARADELATLNEVARRLSTRLSVKQVLDETYQGVKRLVNADNFYIGLYDQPKHEISFLINVTESVTDKQITVMSADDGLSGYIIRNRTSVLVGSGINEWASRAGITVVGQSALSWLGVPMIVGDQVLGVMAIQDYKKSHAYNDHDRDLMTIFANQTGIAIQNALLFERTQNDSLRERTINRISSKIRNAQSVQQILQIATEELRLATHSDRSAAQITVASEAESAQGN